MKKVLITAAVILGVVLCANGAFAYFTDSGDEQNPLDIGSVTTEIEEIFEDPGLPDPGDVITKEVRIRSTGESECLVRAQVLFSDSAMEEVCSLDYNTGAWEYRDGWWYYGTALRTGDCTEPLFTKVSVSADAKEVRAFDVFVRQESRASSDASDSWA